MKHASADPVLIHHIARLLSQAGIVPATPEGSMEPLADLAKMLVNTQPKPSRLREILVQLLFNLHKVKIQLYDERLSRVVWAIGDLLAGYYQKREEKARNRAVSIVHDLQRFTRGEHYR